VNIVDDLLMAMDPVAFSRTAGIVPDDWQADVLRSSASRMLLNCSRQSGKSTITAALAMHTAIYDAGALVLLLSPSLRQSQELFKKCLAVYRGAGRPVPPSAESAMRLELGNGSRVVSLPGTEGSIRGFSAVKLLVIDEASLVENDLYYAVRPMLAVGAGRLIAMSTPHGKRGWWHHEWTEGGSTWERVEIPATACPRIGAAFLAEEERALGPRWFRQEYLCQFSENSEQIFAYDMLMRAVTPDVAPLFGGSHE